MSRPASKAYSVAPPCASLARSLKKKKKGAGPGMCSVAQLLGGILLLELGGM